MIRLAKFIADSGYCSRRAASRLIEAGAVKVNGRTGLHIDRVSGTDEITVEGKPVSLSADFHYLIYNKPVGVDCVCNPDDKNSIVNHFHSEIRVFPVGRLDKDSHGLMLLTNDGELCQKLIHPDYFHEKEYRVQVDKPIDQAFCQMMTAGVQYENVTTRPCKIEAVSSNSFNITLTEGKNRQIRRMCKALGFRVIDLQRTRLLNLYLDSLPMNQTRPLTPEEIHDLKALTC